MNTNIFTLYNINYLEKYNKFICMFKDYNISVKDVIPDHLESKYEEDLSLCIEELKSEDDDYNFHKVYENHVLFLNNLKPAKINMLAYKAFLEIEKNEVVKSNLLAFKPFKGFANIVRYNLSNTVTGRLTVNQGPNILTLPNRCRKIFESRWGNNGSLLSVDFKNLEPRFVKKILGENVENDIYNEILNMLDFKEEIDRSLIKKAVISVMYGKSTPIEGISLKRSEIILQTTKDYFNLHKIYEIANVKYFEKYRRNYFGRPILNYNEEKSNKIINNFIQSSAVDLAMIYFNQLTNTFDENLVKPCFVIHDAFIVDVHNDYLNAFCEITCNGYDDDKLGNFPIEITHFTTGDKLSV